MGPSGFEKLLFSSILKSTHGAPSRKISGIAGSGRVRRSSEGLLFPIGCARGAASLRLAVRGGRLSRVGPSGHERRRDRRRRLSKRLLGGCVRTPAGRGGRALRFRPETWEEAGEKMPSESFCFAAQARLDSKWLKTDIQLCGQRRNALGSQASGFWNIQKNMIQYLLLRKNKRRYRSRCTSAYEAGHLENGLTESCATSY
ncbi:uncharacterized protein LOC129050247 [Pongo abelii]|uniref:uncharacterized protein LOC129050247 n=1 Tax=Pongo abelii TaxID=9601 RepID=UPI003003B550